MPIPWYDNASEVDPNDPEWHDIDRIYCFDWDAFSKEHWEKLTKIYHQLPEPREIKPDSCPRWFSPVDDPQNGYLTASVEPPGLQVFGTLRIDDWREWDKAFQEGVTGLPFREIGNS